MRALIRQLRPALVAVLVFSAVTGVVYPLAVTGIGQVLWNDKANGSLVRRDGVVVGSALIGQPFVSPGYFHPRPSAAGDGYDASASSGSNLGPTSSDLLDAVGERVTAYRSENGLAADQLVPVDAVTASGSGLDPMISVANARLQVSRIATARGISDDQVLQIVAEATEHATFGLLGDTGVNVLRANLALDRLAR